MHQLKNWKESDNWNKVKRLKHLRFHLHLWALGPHCDDSGDFIIVKKRFISDLRCPVIPGLRKAVINRVDNGKLCVVASSASLMPINWQIFVRSGVLYYTAPGMFFIHRAIFAIWLQFQTGFLLMFGLLCWFRMFSSVLILLFAVTTFRPACKRFLRHVSKLSESESPRRDSSTLLYVCTVSVESFNVSEVLYFFCFIVVAVLCLTNVS